MKNVFLILLALLIITLFVSCNIETNSITNVETNSITNVEKQDVSWNFEALVSNKGNVYLYDTAAKKLEPIINIDKIAANVSISPDKKSIAYTKENTIDEDKNAFYINISIIDVETKSEKNFSFDSGGDYVFSTFWLDEKHVVVEAHLNPSVNVYSIINIDNGDTIHYQGTDAVALENGDMLYIGGMNHFYPHFLTGHIRINGEMIYDSNIKGAFIEKMTVSGDKMCFIVPDEENSTNIVVYGNLNTTGKTFAASVEVPLNKKLKNSTPIINDNGELRILDSNSEKVYLFNDSTKDFEISTTESYLDFRREENIITDEVKELIAQTFKESDDEYDIYVFKTCV